MKKRILPMGLITLALILLFVSGLISIYYFVQYERNRDLILWQDKLTYLTLSEKKSIDSWFQEKITGLQNITENQTLKLYLSNVSSSPSGSSKKLSRNYKRYLNELLIIKASELGFFTENNKDIDFNQHLPFKSGLMIVDNTGEFIVSGNSGFSLPSNIIKSIKEGHIINIVKIFDLNNPSNHQLPLGFVLPIYPVQDSINISHTKAIAYLVAIKDIASQIKQLLNNYIFVNQYQKISLLRQDGDQVLYLLTVPRSLSNIKRQFSIDTPNLAAAEAIRNSNHFQQKQNYSGHSVLFYSSILESVPWTIMHSADQQYALSESQAHARFLYISFSVVFFAFICLLIVIWRHSTSLRYQRELEKIQAINDELNASNRMLQLVTDNLSDYVMVIDNNQCLAYGNKAITNVFGLSNTVITGENLPSLLENSIVKPLKNAFDPEKSNNQLITIDDKENRKTLQTSYVSLGDSNEELSMIVATDISNTLKEEKRNRETMQQVVLMLTKILEQHDSYSAQHSARVKTVAFLLGDDLDFNENELFNLTLAASLINIGKFYVPRDILLKQEKLTEKEQQTIKGHILYTIKMLEDINMEKNIIQAVAQSQERLDGSGYPKQLQADDINLFARILAVSNAFVAMIFPRPWRQSMSQTDALDILMKDSGYDKKIIIALYNIIEKKGVINIL